MFKRNLFHTWFGIFILSCMFLMGQESWPPQPTCTDADRDGYGYPADPSCAHPEEDCNDDNADVYPGAPELCDGMDNDCDSTIPPEEDDIDGDTYRICQGDCNDDNADVYPGAMELCDGIDNQCPGDVGYGEVDEGCSGMALIPAGCFDMGDSIDLCTHDPDECPVHNVCISAFAMDVHEVTNAEYEACVHDGGCTAPASSTSFSRATYYGDPTYDHFPVIWVNWYKAKDYCTWAGKRLPTEAEWEYAARGGLAGRRYPWGDTISGSDANFMNSGDPWDNDTSQVEYYAPNGYGLYDMAGNVWEWVEDDYHSSYVGAPADGSAWVDDPRGTLRVSRGGGWGNSQYNRRVAARGYYYPFDFGVIYHIGFRCAR